MNGRGHQLAIDKALQAGGAALGQIGKTGTALSQRPFQERIVAATDGG